MFCQAASSIIETYHLGFQTYSELSSSSSLVSLTNIDLLRLYRVLLGLNMGANEETFLAKLGTVSTLAQSGTFDRIIVPYIRELLNLIKAKDAPLSFERYRQTLARVFTAYTRCLVPHNIRSSEDPTSLHSMLLHLGMTPELDNFLGRLKTQCVSMSASKLDTVLLPFARACIISLKATGLTSGHDSHHELLATLLLLCAQRSLPKQPPLPRSLIERRGCGCPDSAILDSFLMDPCRKTHSFQENDKVRKHLQGRIDQEAGVTSRFEKGNRSAYKPSALVSPKETESMSMSNGG